jgi:hypothetical protein
MTGYVKNMRLAGLIGVFAVLLHVLSLFLIWSPYHNLEPAGEWLKNPTLVPLLGKNGLTYSIGAERLFNNTYEKGWYRRDPLDHPSYILRNTFTPDKSLLWSVPQLEDYTGRSLRRPKLLKDLLSQSVTLNDSTATISATGVRLLSVLSVRNVISTLELTQTGLVQHAELRDPTHRIVLFENPAAVPKAYIASRFTIVSTTGDAARAVSQDSFIPGSSVLVESELPVNMYKNPPPVTVWTAGEGRYTFSVSGLGQDAVFVLSETYYPGWHIRADGTDLAIFPVNITDIGAVLPKGTRMVTAEYSPASYRWGEAVSLLTLIVIVSGAASDLFRSIFYTRRGTFSLFPDRSGSRDT